MTTDLRESREHRRLRHDVGTLAGGAFMGAAEIVPGVSGGTIALVFGIYDALITTLSTGAGALGRLLRGDLRGAAASLRRIDWRFLVALLVGMGGAILLLSHVMEGLLEDQPVVMSSLFAGLVAGSVVLALRELHARPTGTHVAVMVLMAVTTFVALGATPGRISDPSLPVFFGAAALAVCAMILPGISGSFILLLLGMYEPVLAAVSGRDLPVLVVFAVGAVTGLALFSSWLHRLLQRHHDLTLAVLIGLMAGSMRVLWPWPSGPEGVGDARLGAPVADDLVPAVLAALVGLVVVVGIARLGDVTVGDDPIDLDPAEEPDAGPGPGARPEPTTRSDQVGR